MNQVRQCSFSSVLPDYWSEFALSCKESFSHIVFTPGYIV